MLKKILLALLGCTLMLAAQANERVVAAGGSLVELIYALGAGDLLVGVDESTTWPVETQALPQIGYWRQLNIEGILSLRPDIFISWQDAEPKLVLDQLRQNKVRVVLLPRIPAKPEQMYANIMTLTKELKLGNQGQALIDSIRQRLEKIASSNADKPAPARVIFILHSGSGPVQVAGRGSVADTILSLAGAKNMAQHQEYKSYSAEALIAADPDFIVVTSQMAAGDWSKIASIPGLTRTKAWQNKHIVTIDQALILGMGPRVAQAVEILHQQFWPQ